MPEINGYFDYAGSSPPFPEALEKQTETARKWYANPSSLHSEGIKSADELNRLKSEFSMIIGFHDGNFILTSGATESNNFVIRGILSSSLTSRVLVAADVHVSVWNTCQCYQKRMDVIPLESNGTIKLSSIAERIKPETCLVCVSHASNETGVIHDVSAIADLCERYHVFSLIDGAQTLGHIPVNMEDIPFDFYTFSAHKFGGPRGCGGILSRSNKCQVMMTGGSQEQGLRPGTENIAGLAGAMKAIQLSVKSLKQETTRLRGLASLIIDELNRNDVQYLLNGDPHKGLPGFISISFPGLIGHTLVAELALLGFAVTTGSACHAHQEVPSRIISALGRSSYEASGTIRISLGRLTSEDSVIQFVNNLVEIIHRQ